MYFDSCENTTMMNISTINNQDDGVQFESCENTTMINISAISNQDNGMYFDSCENMNALKCRTLGVYNARVRMQENLITGESVRANMQIRSGLPALAVKNSEKSQLLIKVKSRDLDQSLVHIVV